MSIVDDIRRVVIRGHIDANAKYPPDLKGEPGVREFVQRALDEKVPLSEIVRSGLIAGMDEVGAKFSAGEYFVPEMLMSAKAMKGGLEIVRPLMVGAQSMSAGRVILGTVKGDMHDIGKNLVGMMLEGAGFEIVDVGINAPPEKFVDAARQHPDAIVGLSALLTITMQEMGTTIRALRGAGLANRVMVGGAPVSQQFADEIGADGYAPDAGQAVALAKRLVAAVAA